MKKSLEKILQSIEAYEIIGPRKVSISGIAFDSRKVRKNFAFFAIKGQKFDGHDFIPEAIKKGASVIFAEEKFKFEDKKTFVFVKNTKLALAQAASRWYGNPAGKLTIIGVTGTDGKTTTSNLIFDILKQSGKRVGLISTVNAIIGAKKVDTGLHVTSPDPLTLNKLLGEMVKKGVKYAVVEVTSHGIDQKRVEGVNFDIGVLTNITHEHTDYHGSFRKYRDTKINFLKKCKKVLLNKDDPSFKYALKKIDKSKVYTYSSETAADFSAAGVRETKKGLNFTILEGNIKKKIMTNLQGRYNLLNALAAISAARLLNVDYTPIKSKLLSVDLPPGRLEKVSMGQDFEIYVDFAHTPNSLQSVLGYLKDRKKGRLISVFGCAGERDKKKRAMMGKISATLSDISIFTAEDPRSEDIGLILNQMAKGALEAGAEEMSLDGGEKLKEVKAGKHIFAKIRQRGEAIAFAIHKIAKKGDCVVICGKGHEKSMAYGGFEHPWSDRAAVERALNADKDKTAIVLAAGEATRMKSQTPKVLHKIAGRPMIAYTIENLRKAGIRNLIVVVGYKKEKVKNVLKGAVAFAHQPKALGTGHATQQGLKKVKQGKHVIVLNGDDSFFYKPETINDIFDSHKKNKAKITFVSLIRENPEGLGRIVRDKKGNLEKIVEEKEANTAQKKIKEVNDGLYVFERKWLKKNLAKIKKSTSSGEYYLVELVVIALNQNDRVNVYKLKDSSEWEGVNTMEQLMRAEKKMRLRLRKRLNNG